MEDQTTWKGHSFTLIVFTGIVVLCSIFFILGMIVGRQNAQKLATIAAAEAASKAEGKAESGDDKPHLTFYDAVEKNQQPPLEAPAAAPAPAEPAKEAAAPPAPPPPAQNAFNFQVGAFRQQSVAEKVLNELRKKGFKGFILSPPSGDASPVYRVQVGPFPDMVAAESARKKLESQGYQPILKK